MGVIKPVAWGTGAALAASALLMSLAGLLTLTAGTGLTSAEVHSNAHKLQDGFGDRNEIGGLLVRCRILKGYLLG